MRILVTGASGFIGSHLCRALLQAGYPTRALIRPTSSLVLIDDLALDFRLGDLLDPDSLRGAMEDVDVVIHCGAEVGGSKERASMVASHVDGTENILKAANRTGIRRLIYTSSVAALGVPRLTPSKARPALMNEDHLWNYSPEKWPYGYAKHTAEEKVRAAAAEGLEALILNPAAVIGPGDKNLVASAIVYHMGRGGRPPIPLGGLNIVHIDDVIAGYLAAIERGRSGERYILGGENLTFEAILQEIADVVEVSPLRLRPPRWVFNLLASFVDYVNPLVGLPVRGHLLRMVGRHFYYDISKAQQELGVAPVHTTHDAVASAHAWYQAHPGLVLR